MSRNLVVSLAAALFLALPGTGLATEALLPEPRLGDNGLHVQDWFLQSFLDIGEDLSDARDAGKGLVVIFEQAGCPYCREMHQVNLRKPAVIEIVRDNFEVLQLDLRGSREVTDTDGETMTEGELARKWGVVFTPTLVFIPRDAETGKPGDAIAASVMPGYFKPFHFATMFEYVASGAYKEQHFQDFLNERAARLRANGEEATIWE